ncbi:hypothetical protein BDE02_04G090400 [Populus trichocarpa]|nr:hypothetical protein BDE02_04G090400 [Populus trichocarpa]
MKWPGLESFHGLQSIKEVPFVGHYTVRHNTTTFESIHYVELHVKFLLVLLFHYIMKPNTPQHFFWPQFYKL